MLTLLAATVIEAATRESGQRSFHHLRRGSLHVRNLRGQRDGREKRDLAAVTSLRSSDTS